MLAVIERMAVSVTTLPLTGLNGRSNITPPSNYPLADLR
jgi:hypothetical protein